MWAIFVSARDIFYFRLLANANPLFLESFVLPQMTIAMHRRSLETGAKIYHVDFVNDTKKRINMFQCEN